MRGGTMAAAALLLGAILAAAGCAGLGAKPAVLVEQYTLEYAPPGQSDQAPLAAGLLVERFSLAQEYADQGMVYRPEAFRRQVYNYHRWRANPADLVGDHLVRDLRAAQAFSGVFTLTKPGVARFTLQGGVREFLEVDEAGGSKAVLEVEVALLDARERELPRRLIFQRTYRQEAAMAAASAPELARAMSQCMAQLSRQVLADARQGAAARLAEPDAGGVTK
ncbi:MAG: ABC-type transport auxiliary lipoprotein family protein [Thermodesulfobacteriota bacterium]